jgi:hypothetical protein
MKTIIKKKRHHYIPRFYLDGFVDPGNEPYIWVYEKGKPNIIKATAENVAVRKHYYSFIRAPGDENSFEDIFAKIESEVAPIFKKIINHEKLKNEERSSFAYFLALIMMRVPKYRENIERVTGEIIKSISMLKASDIEGFKSMIKKFEKDKGSRIGAPTEELQEFILSGEFDIVVNPQFSLGMLGLAKHFAPIFHAMNWAFLEASDYKFVTSDNPLFYYDPTYYPTSVHGVGLLSKNIEVTFPISKDLMLFASWNRPEGYEKLNNKMVKDSNCRTIISALRFVFAPLNSKDLNRTVQKYKNSSPIIKMV